MWALQALTYLAVVVFVVFVGRKAAKYANAPMHLRWELYPVPHEEGKEYGGSYLEELNWWTKPRHTSLWGEVKGMVPEMLFIKTLWERNRALWFVSYPFHGGIYVFAGFLALVILGALVTIFGGKIAATGDWWQVAIYWLTWLAGVVSGVSVSFGCLGLLGKRLADEDVRRYSVPSDYFNLLFILAIALSGLYAWLFVDPAYAQYRAFAAGLLTLNPAALSPAIIVPVVLLLLFMIYLPFTHMTHFVGKWFSYHTVRWDDTPNKPGSAYEQQLGNLIQRPIGWSAPHIGGGKGQKWVDVVTRGGDK